MCTCILWNGFFCRNLDLWFPMGDEKTVTMTPGQTICFRGTARNGRKEKRLAWSVSGTARVADGFPLFYEAMNGPGLAVAALHFPNSARWHEPLPDRENISSWEVIPQLMAECRDTDEVRRMLENANITGEPFREDLPPTPLHWMAADRRGRCIVIEQTDGGLHLYDDPAGVITNEPPFPVMLARLQEDARLSPAQPRTDAARVSYGMGGLGLPGDFSSASRFRRAAYVRRYMTVPEQQSADRQPARRRGEALTMAFRLLEAVTQYRGCVDTGEGMEYTVYSSVYDLETGGLWYRLYGDMALRPALPEPGEE